MKSGQVTTEMAARYFRLFVNRLAYTVQSHRPDDKGKHYYYRPRDARRLSHEAVREHLFGQITIGIYAINPQTQRSKWVAIDADYDNALDDLLKLQWELQRDGVEAALEESRRGAHLWIFCDKPLLARDCRIYIYNLALRLRVPVKGGTGLADRIEVFPRQDELRPEEFGNAIRGPLGIHRAAHNGTGSTAPITRLKRNGTIWSGLRGSPKPRCSTSLRDWTCPRNCGPGRKSYCLPSIPIDVSSAFLISFTRGAGDPETIGLDAPPAPSKARIEPEITWQSRLLIRASTSVGLGARAR